MNEKNEKYCNGRMHAALNKSPAMLFLEKKKKKKKKTYGKRHIDVRPTEGEKLLGDPAAVQSLAAMVQATGVRLSPAIDRVKQTTE